MQYLVPVLDLAPSRRLAEEIVRRLALARTATGRDASIQQSYAEHAETALRGLAKYQPIRHALEALK